MIVSIILMLIKVNGPYWIGYDELDSIKLKSQFINYRQLGGALIFSIDTDDFRGDFSDHKYPMTMVLQVGFKHSIQLHFSVGSSESSLHW